MPGSKEAEIYKKKSFIHRVSLHVKVEAIEKRKTWSGDSVRAMIYCSLMLFRGILRTAGDAFFSSGEL